MGYAVRLQLSSENKKNKDQDRSYDPAPKFFQVFNKRKLSVQKHDNPFMLSIDLPLGPLPCSLRPIRFQPS